MKHARRTRIRSLAAALFALPFAGSPAAAQAELYQLPGASDFIAAGTSVASAGDVDGDGFDDILVGQPGVETPMPPPNPPLPRAQVFSGRTGALLHTVVGQADSWMGFSVAGIGDVNGDGHDDFLVGAPGLGPTGSSAGTARAISGATGALLWATAGVSPGDGLGWAVTGLGDITGDGIGDVAIGAPFGDLVASSAGYVQFRSGSNGAILSQITGGAQNEYFGYSVRGVGDMNGDGFGELAIGVPQGLHNGFPFGKVIVYSWATTSWHMLKVGPDVGSWYGGSVGGGVDVDADGTPDLIVGARDADLNGFNSGLVDVFSGADGALIHHLEGDALSYFGMSVAGLGDVDGDGRAEFLVGATAVSYPNAQGAGWAGLHSGATAQVLSSWHGTVDYEEFGRSVASAGFVNADALPDVVIGAPSSAGLATVPGTAHVYLSGASSPLVYCTALQNSAGCVPSAAAAGVASLSVGDGLHVAATGVLNQQNGILFWGLAPASAPFGGGTLCVQAPTVRTPVQSSGGNTAGSDCSGSYAFQFDAAYLGAHGTAPGTAVYAQFWSRDPALVPYGIGLTDAVKFDVVP